VTETVPVIMSQRIFAYKFRLRRELSGAIAKPCLERPNVN